MHNDEFIQKVVEPTVPYCDYRIYTVTIKQSYRMITVFDTEVLLNFPTDSLSIDSWVFKTYHRNVILLVLLSFT